MNFTQKSTLALVGKFFSSFLGLIISVLLARYLEVSGVGQYQLLLSTQVLFTTVLAMGFGNASVFFINSKKIDKKNIISNLFKMFFLISIFLSIILGFSLFFFNWYFGHLEIIAILIFVLGSGALLLYNILAPTLYASLDIIKLQILGISSSLILLVGIFLLNLYVKFDINYAIIIVGLSNFSATLILFYFLKNDIDIYIELDLTLIKELFFYGIKISATNFVFILSTNIVVFLIKFFQENEGFDGIGLYSRATSIANIFILLPTTLGPLFYSKWSFLSSDDIKVEIEKVLRILIFITCFTTLFIFLFGEYIISILYGNEFLKAKISLNILTFSVIFSSVVIVFSNLFSSLGKPEIILKTFSFSLIITFLLALFFVPILSIEGASISVLIGILFNSIILTYYCKKEIGLSLKKSIFITRNDVEYLIKAIKN